MLAVQRFLSDQQLDNLEYHEEWLRRGGSCPTCDDTGSYWYGGVEHECVKDDVGRCEQQMLFRQYCLANIPYEYQTLPDTFPADEKLGDQAEIYRKYIENFRTARMSGLGWEFFGANIGVGKTWAGAHLLKQLAKADYACWFVQFRDVKNYWEMNDSVKRDYLTTRLREAEVLMLDEVLVPATDRAARFYEEKLEEVVRARTSHHFPTIITTNMRTEQMERDLPRCYSLLSAKQFRVEVTGEDYRPQRRREDGQLVFNGEVRPIT